VNYYKQNYTFYSKGELIRHLDQSWENNFIVAAYADKHVKVYNIANGKLKCNIKSKF